MPAIIQGPAGNVVSPPQPRAHPTTDGGESARLPETLTIGAPLAASRSSVALVADDHVNLPVTAPARSASEEIQSWDLPGTSVTIKQATRVFEDWTREQGLQRRNPAEFLHPPIATDETVPSELKAKFYQKSTALIERFWVVAEPALAKTKARLLERARRGEYSDAAQLKRLTQRTLRETARAFWKTLSPQDIADYEAAMVGAEHRVTYQVVDGELAFSPRTPLSHFQLALDSGPSELFNLARSLELTVEAHLKAGGWLPADCRTDVLRLFEQPFVEQAFNFNQALGGSHNKAHTVIGIALRMDVVDRQKDIDKEGVGFALLPEGGQLSFGLSQAGKHNCADKLDELFEYMKNDGKARFGCPAMRARPPDAATRPDGARQGIELHVVQAMRNFCLELSKAHVFPKAALELRNLHLKAVQAQTDA